MKNTFNFLIISLIGVITLTMSCNTASSQQNENRNKNSLENKNFYVYGGWDGHEPTQSWIFVPWMKSEGAEVSMTIFPLRRFIVNGAGGLNNTTFHTGGNYSNSKRSHSLMQ